MTLGWATVLSCYKLVSGIFLNLLDQKLVAVFRKMCTDFDSVAKRVNMLFWTVSMALRCLLQWHWFIYYSFNLFSLHICFSPSENEYKYTDTYSHTYGEFRVSSPPDLNVFGMLELMAHIQCRGDVKTKTTCKPEAHKHPRILCVLRMEIL